MNTTERDRAAETKGKSAPKEKERDTVPEVTFEVDPEPVEAPPLPMSVTAKLPARAWPPKVVSDLMTRKVITVQENEPIGELEAWMERFRFRHLPIVGSAGKLVGLITRTDFLHASLGQGPDGREIAKPTAETTAAAIMRRGVVTAKPNAELTTALRVMLAEKIGCLPVIDEDGTLVGIVTETDFARLALEGLERAAARA